MPQGGQEEEVLLGLLEQVLYAHAVRSGPKGVDTTAPTRDPAQHRWKSYGQKWEFV